MEMIQSFVSINWMQKKNDSSWFTHMLSSPKNWNSRGRRSSIYRCILHYKNTIHVIDLWSTTTCAANKCKCGVHVVYTHADCHREQRKTRFLDRDICVGGCTAKRDAAAHAEWREPCCDEGRWSPACARARVHAIVWREEYTSDQICVMYVIIRPKVEA